MKKKEPKKKNPPRQYDDTEFVKDKSKKNLGTKEKPKFNNPKKWLLDADDDEN